MKHLHCFYILAFACLLTACGDSDTPAEVRKQLHILFSVNGLGDMGYNDCLLTGIQRVRKAHAEADFYFYNPASEAEAEEVFRTWLEKESEVSSLFVLAASDYEAMAKRLLPNHPPIGNKEILLFESKNPDGLPLHSFDISMYGASFLAGVAAVCCTPLPPLVLLGNSEDASVQEGVDGFTDGYRFFAEATEVATLALADDWTGYSSAETAYRNMFEWAQLYGFIFPIAGGSNMGIYRYLREYPKGIYTAGMDVDQSPLCTQITGSVVKHIDRLLEEQLTQWIETGAFPSAHLYGLESGCVEWLLSPDYEEALGTAMKEYLGIAILKEKEYEEN
ncbi:MAG: BMP family ABC transporter substrate-binding protein [Bacteroides sp.]|nr:BMP family ABC transporter substrate-binding protein [Bacteroides sp.]